MSKHPPEENIYTAGQVILVNKPLHWTSFDVVKKIRNLTRSKVGHAGTLDPLATGLLICCTGKFTKRITEYQAQEKEYTGTFTIGAETPTYDLESEPRNFKDFSAVIHRQILLTAEKFTGELSQAPPAHSAVKKDGKPLYHSARKGVEVKVEPRTIFIKEFEITNTLLPQIHFRVVCSTGTYIRSLAFDFGNELGCGAYLSALCRTRIGRFLLKDAYPMNSIEEVIKSNLLKTDSLPQNLK
ncbi:MAG: tRNA pseudouridine(55) synthase TruB [Chitinophagaceae bacterium]